LDTSAATIMGIPIAPNATGAVLASRQILAAYMGTKPKPTSIAVVMATGVPKPAVPSIKAPKAKAIKIACNLLSSVIFDREVLIISNCFVSIVILYSHIVVTIIQIIGNIPKIIPKRVAFIAKMYRHAPNCSSNEKGSQ